MVQFRFLFVYKNPQYREILRRMQPTRAFHVYSSGLCFLLMAISISVALPPVDKQISRQVALFVEGDSSSIPKFINVCRQMGPERGLDFRFIDRQSEAYDYRVV